MKLRVLFVGFDDNAIPNKLEDEELTWCHPQFFFDNNGRQILYQVPTLDDFQILIFSQRSVETVFSILGTQKFIEVEHFLKAPFNGLMIVPIVSSDEYGWTTVAPSLRHVPGKGIQFNDNHFLAPLFKKYADKITWQGHLDESSYSEEFCKGVIAYNTAHSPIGFEIKKDNGTILFIPCVSFTENFKEKEFLRELLNKVKDKFKIIREAVSPPPWILHPEYSFEKEKSIETDIKRLIQEKDVFDTARSILWLGGIDLSDKIAFVLRQLGINCTVTEKDGRHDIEINEPGFHAIVEVKGLEGYANVDALRQLRDWHDEKIKEDENVKGIMIINEFKLLEPKLRKEKCKETIKDRDYPYTRDAVRVAERNQFCLLTTYQIFKQFVNITNGTYDKTKFLETIKNSSGFAKFE